MWPDRVSNPGPLTYEPGALPTALHGPAGPYCINGACYNVSTVYRCSQPPTWCRFRKPVKSLTYEYSEGRYDTADPML